MINAMEDCIDYIGKSGMVKVEFEWIGEGWDGDYDEEDPDDTPLLRFSVYRLDGHVWEAIDDASYCTRMPATSDVELVMDAAQYVMDRIEYLVLNDYSIKKACEHLSWIHPDWIQKPDENQSEEDIL